MAKRILVVAEEEPLRASRVSLLKREGYEVEFAASDDDAMHMLEMEVFDLILLGRNSYLDRKNLDQRLRERFPRLLTLKIVNQNDATMYASRKTDSAPGHVIAALHEMLGDDVYLVPVELFGNTQASEESNG